MDGRGRVEDDGDDSPATEDGGGGDGRELGLGFRGDALSSARIDRFRDDLDDGDDGADGADGEEGMEASSEWVEEAGDNVGGGGDGAGDGEGRDFRGDGDEDDIYP